MSTDRPAVPEAAELDPAGVVLRFLESVGRPDEARFYLDLFRAKPREQFAAIAIDGNVVRDATDAVVLDLRFLTALDLFPIVVLGLFQPADAAAHSRRLHRRLASAGVGTVTLSASAPDATMLIAEAVSADLVPIVTFAAVSNEPPAERFTAIGKLLGVLQTRKLIFLQRQGGLKQHGVPVPLVNLTTDVPGLLASRDLSRKEAQLVEQSRRLVHDVVPHPLLVAITSPLNLLRELFTIKGAGTLLRRGATILRHDGWTGVDRERLRALLEASFARKCSDAFFERDVARIYREESWRGAAVLLATPLGAYLSKFAVSPEAQGEGMARDLWDALVAENPVLYWRAREDNPVVDWYARLCDGSQRLPEWRVFWKGMTVEKIPEAVAAAVAQPVDMLRPDPP